MTIPKNYFRLWFFLFIPAMIAASYYFYMEDKKIKDEKYWTLSNNIGKTFTFDDLIDSAGNKVFPKPESDETIIDFWFTTCPPCIAELKQFEKLLKGKEKDISIVSISIDGPEAWEKVFKSGDAHFDFIHEKAPNWQIVNLHMSDTSRPEKDYVTSMYGITSFPGYLVLDRAGKIIATPQSAVEYINRKKLWLPAFLLYIIEHILTMAGILNIFYALLFFSGAYWSISFSMLYLIRKNRRMAI